MWGCLRPCDYSVLLSVYGFIYKRVCAAEHWTVTHVCRVVCLTAHTSHRSCCASAHLPTYNIEWADPFRSDTVLCHL